MNNTTEPSRGYPIPDAANTIAQDFPRIASAITQIGADVAAADASIAGKAALGHTHQIADVTGLQAALDGKSAMSHNHALSSLTDVNVTGIASGQLLGWVGLKFVPVTISIQTLGGVPASTVGSVGGAVLGAATQAAAQSALGLGTAATLNAGTAANNLVQLDGSGKLPAVDGSQLTGIGNTVTWTAVQNKPATLSGFGITDGLSKTNNLSDVASPTMARANLGLGTAAIATVGTGANNIPSLDGSGRLPAVDGSQLINLSVSWGSITSKPTTRAGYGITDVPKTDGTGASGTWAISISGNAATATNASHASSADAATNASYAGSAGAVPWTGVSGRPTALSQFANDAGFVTSAQVDAAIAAYWAAHGGGGGGNAG